MHNMNRMLSYFQGRVKNVFSPYSLQTKTDTFANSRDSEEMAAGMLVVQKQFPQ